MQLTRQSFMLRYFVCSLIRQWYKYSVAMPGNVLYSYLTQWLNCFLYFFFFGNKICPIFLMQFSDISLWSRWILQGCEKLYQLFWQLSCSLKLIQKNALSLKQQRLCFWLSVPSSKGHSHVHRFVSLCWKRSPYRTAFCCKIKTQILSSVLVITCICCY